MSNIIIQDIWTFKYKKLKSIIKASIIIVPIWTMRAESGYPIFIVILEPKDYFRQIFSLHFGK